MDLIGFLSLNLQRKIQNIKVMKKVFFRLFCTVIVISYLSLLSSCQHQQEKVCPVINLGNVKECSVSDLFSKIEIVPLAMREGNFLGNVDRVQVSDNYYVVSDSRQILTVFDKTGKFVSSSEAKIGNGHEEYSIVMGYSYNPYNNNIEILTPTHLLCYDVNFNLLKKVKLPTKLAKSKDTGLMFDRIYDLSKHLHVLIPTSVSGESTGMLVFDSSSSKILKNIDYEMDEIDKINMQSDCFFLRKGSAVTFVPPIYSDYIYTFDATTMECSRKYKFEGGSNMLTKNDLEAFGSNENKKNLFLMNTDKEILVSKMEVDKAIIVHVKKGNRLSDWYSVLYDKASGELKKINLYSGKKKIFPLIKNVDAQSLYAYVEKQDLPSMLECWKQMGCNVEGNVQNEDGFIVKYTLK